MKKIFLRLGLSSFTLTLTVILWAGTAFAGTTPAITNIAHKNGVARVLVEFNAPVWSDTAYTAGLAAADFQLGGTCGATSISSVTHAAGDDWAILTVAGTIAADESACTIAAKANNIFTVGGALSEKTLAWDAAADATGPVISTIFARDTQTDILVTLNEPAFTNATATGALVDADFTFADSVAGNCASLSAGADELHVAGNNWVVLQCNAAVVAGDLAGGIDDITLTTGVFDTFGNASVTGTAVNLVSDTTAPTFATGFVATKGEATVGGTKILVKFSEPVFDAAVPALADLVNADFTYTNTSAGGATALAATAQQTNDQEWVVLTVDAAFLAADLTVATADTIDEAATAIFDAVGTAKSEAAIGLQDNTDPVITSLAYTVNAGGQNQFALTYSEKVTITGLTTASATMAASTATVGDLAAVGALQGFGDFATDGTITVPTTLNTLAIDSTQTIITVTIAGASRGYMATSTTTITVPSGVFTPDIAGAGIQDLRPSADTANDIETTSVQSTLTTTTAWDTTRPTIAAGVLSDDVYNNAAFVAGGTFNTGNDGRADHIVFTASEPLKGNTLMADAAGTRNDWAITAAAGEFGNALVVINAEPVTAGDTGATYEIHFSGAQSYYANPTTFNVVNTQDAAPSFTDRAGNPVATGLTGQTYRVCFTGLTCSGSDFGNVAVITSSIIQPSNTGSDSTGPAAPKSLVATVVSATEVKLTWTDPTDADLSNIKIYRVKNGASETSPDVLLGGVKTFADKSVVKGDKVKYRISGFDRSGNEGAKTEYTAELTVEDPIPATDTATDTVTDATDTATDTTAEAPSDHTVSLTAVGTSGITGNVTFNETDDGNIGVDAFPTGADAAMTYPMHIHSGTCSEAGAIKYSLTSVVNNASQSFLDNKTWDELLAEGPLYINIHKSEAEIGVILACGEFPTVEEDAAAEAAADDTTVEEEDTTAAVTLPFKDTATHWAKDYIATLYSMDIVKSADKFNPDSDITRGEFLKIVMEAFDIAKGSASSTVFTDIKNHWAAAYCDGAKKAGMVKGYEDGTCRPDAKITRAEASKMLLEAIGYEKDSPEAKFSDVKTGDWFAVYVNYAVKMNVVKGFADGTFRPHQNITRGETAKVVALALEY